MSRFLMSEPIEETVPPKRYVAWGNNKQMMMRKLLRLTIFLLIVSVSVRGQDKTHYNKLVSEATRYFDEEQYRLAADLFTEALTFNIPDPAIDYKLAECYRRTFNYTEAEVYYLKVLYTGQTMFPLSLYYYALMLKLNGNLPEAMQRFDEFISVHDREAALKDFVDQAVIERAGCEIAQQELGLPSSFRQLRVTGEINTIYNDFAPAFLNNETLVITSSRVASNRTLIDQRYGEAFTDNYLFQRGEKGWLDKTRQQFSVTNTLYNDGTGSFTKRGDQYFFTICEEQCRIYESHLTDNKWTKPSALNESINHPFSESKHPAISPGGDTLYFASNRPGGHGQFDIWISIDKGDNEWSEAVNAGAGINTKANEMAPAVTDVSNALFFSSEGHPGYGGYDLFLAKTRLSDETAVYNLTFPFNSVKDDCFITFHDREIYWSSNRSGGLGGFDIYASSNTSALALVSKLTARNRNDSRTIALTSRTARSENIHLLASRNEETIDYNNLTYERKSVVNRMIENRLGQRDNRREDFSELSDDEYKKLDEISNGRVQALLLKQKYSSSLLTEVMTTNGENGAALSITGEIINSHSGTALKSARILLTNEFGDILKITSTNDQGRFRFTDVPPNAKFFLRLENTSAGSVNAIARNIRSAGSENSNSLYVENVYFDFDHYVIRPEGARVLIELAGYLKSNPGAQVEIYAFADDRGSSAYNFELTQKRGASVVSFLTKHGVDETSLAIVPKGKQAISPAATEIQRQYNRRAEFYINGASGRFTSSVKTYILKKEADWNQISRATGIRKDELKELNNADTEIVKAFQPVRVPLDAANISDELFFVGI